MFKKAKVRMKKWAQAHKKQAAASAVAVALIVAMYPSKYLRPHKTAEFARTSVMITNMAQNSGGSGVILESHSTESIILTNSHVCGVVEHGGLVIHEGEKYLVSAYKRSTQHDLCEIKVNSNLHVNTKVADNAPEKYSDAFISGHPALFPHVLTKGSFSGHMQVQVMTGMRPCTDEDMQSPNALMCFFMGGIPIIKTYESQLVTGTILPGSSGSAVFDSNGEIAGLVFASNSRELSYAMIVPHEFVKSFTQEEAPKIPWQAPTPKDKAQPDEESSRKNRIFTSVEISIRQEYV